MSEPQIVCPNCSHEIKLTESLAAPLIAATRQKFHEQLAAKDAEVAKKEEVLRTQQEQLVCDRESIENQIAARLTAERSQIAAVETKKAREAAATSSKPRARN
jgi:hypothetical protein